MNCLILEKSAVDDVGSASLDERQSKHVIEVLGKNVGDSVTGGIVDGPLGMSKIISMDDDRVVISKPAGDVPPKPPVHLILAMPRSRVMKRLWAQLASIGVGSITIIGAKKVEAFYFASHSVREDVYRPLLIEGLEQARDTRLPGIKIIKSFHWFSRHYLSEYADSCAKIICHPGAVKTIRGAVESKRGAEVFLAVGPEGGWTNRELTLFGEHGFEPAGLHDRSLRTDTAIISLLALTYDSLSSPATERRSYNKMIL